MSSFSEGCGLEMVGGGGWVLYPCFLDIAYPYRVDLGAGVSSAGVCLAVYISIVVFARAIVSQPACRRAAAAFRGPIPSFRRFSFFSTLPYLLFSALTVISLPARAGKLLFVGMAGVSDA